MQTRNNFQYSQQQHTDNLNLFDSSSQQPNSTHNSTSPHSQSISHQFLDVNKHQILQNLIQQLQPLLQNQKLPFKKVIKKGQITKNKNQCSICQQLIPKDFRIPRLQCKHIFHFSCLKKWYQHNTNCPLCRRQLVS